MRVFVLFLCLPEQCIAVIFILFYFKFRLGIRKLINLNLAISKVCLVAGKTVYCGDSLFVFLLGIKKMINLNLAYGKVCLVAGKCGRKSGNN